MGDARVLDVGGIGATAAALVGVVAVVGTGGGAAGIVGYVVTERSDLAGFLMTAVYAEGLLRAGGGTGGSSNGEPVALSMAGGLKVNTSVIFTSATALVEAVAPLGTGGVDTLLVKNVVIKRRELASLLNGKAAIEADGILRVTGLGAGGGYLIEGFWIVGFGVYLVTHNLITENTIVNKTAAVIAVAYLLHNTLSLNVVAGWLARGSAAGCEQHN